MLSKRQKQILKMIVEEYVKTAIPVGSSSICDSLRVSSATVRNDMAVLEKEEYIEKAHSSGGRIPLDKGYRFYVEVLLNEENEKSFESKAYELVDSIFMNNVREREDAIKKAVSLLSEMTNYTSVALGPDKGLSRISKIELISLRPSQYLMLIVTDSGHVETKNVEFNEEEVSTEEVAKVIDILNEVLNGTPLNEVSYKLTYIMENHLVQEFLAYKESIIENFINAFMRFAESNYYISGSSNMLVQPEFQDSNKLRKLLDVFEKRELVNIIKANPSDSLQVKIGKETGLEALDDTTIITVPYIDQNGEKGNLALVGPTRMDYKKVIPLIEYIAKNLSKKR